MGYYQAPTTMFEYPKTIDYFAPPVYVGYSLCQPPPPPRPPPPPHCPPPPPPPSSPLHYFCSRHHAQPTRHTQAQPQFQAQHPWHGKTKDEKRREKKKAKQQRRAARGKALIEAAARASGLAETLHDLELEGQAKGKEKCRAVGAGVQTPPDSLHEGEGVGGEGCEDRCEGDESEAEDDEDYVCEPFDKAGRTCCAEHGKGCWRFPDLVAMKRYLPTWRELETGEQSGVMRKHSV